ncbi:MAG: hypothetical protein AAB578_08265 [Elusimicrobiota bacterium]
MNARLARVDLRDIEPARRPEHCCAVAEAHLDDGRQFSILTATPSWFSEALSNAGMRYYYGSLVLFVRRMDSALVKKAVAEMVAAGDRCLCLHDTPRTTLPRVLADFKARHI